MITDLDKQSSTTNVVSISFDEKILGKFSPYFDEKVKIRDISLQLLRLVFQIDGDKFDMVIKDSDISFDTFGYDDDINPRELLQKLFDNRIEESSVEFNYIIAPGPFDYESLSRQYPDVDEFVIWPNSDPYEFKGVIDKAGNEYLSQYGLYDANEPIPDDFQEGEFNLSLYIRYVGAISEWDL
jgi:hypothetical protein